MIAPVRAWAEREGVRCLRLAEQVDVLTSSWGRVCGLLARTHLAPGEAVWLASRWGVHTIGLVYPIDVLFLDERNLVLRVTFNAAPNRLLRAPAGCRAVLELAAGAATGVEIGDRIALETPGPREEGTEIRSQQDRR